MTQDLSLLLLSNFNNFIIMKGLSQLVESLWILTAPTCGNDSWIHFQGYCYLFSNTIDTPDEKRNWFDASDYCRQQGADLASIHTDAEQEMLTLQVNIPIYIRLTLKS